MDKISIKEIRNYLHKKKPDFNYVFNEKLQARTRYNIEKLELILKKDLDVYKYKNKQYPNFFSVLAETEEEVLIFHRYNPGIGRTLFKALLKYDGRIIRTLVSIDIGLLTSAKNKVLDRTERLKVKGVRIDLQNIVLSWNDFEKEG